MLVLICESVYVLIAIVINDERDLNYGFFSSLADITKDMSYTDTRLLIGTVLTVTLALTLISAVLPSKLLFAHTRNLCMGRTTRERHGKMTNIQDAEAMMIFSGIQGDI